MTDMTASSQKEVVHNLLRAHGSKVVGITLFGSATRGKGREAGYHRGPACARAWALTLRAGLPLRTYLIYIVTTIVIIKL